MPQGKFTVADVDTSAIKAPNTPEEGDGVIAKMKSIVQAMGRAKKGSLDFNPAMFKDMLERAANPRELGDFAQLLLPSAMVGGGEIAGGMAAESADMLGEGAAAVGRGVQAARGPVGRGMQTVGQGLDDAGAAARLPVGGAGLVYGLSRHPVVGGAVIGAPLAVQGLGKTINALGRVVEGAPRRGPQLASLGLNPEEAAIQRALEMLKEQRAAAPAAAGYGELAPKATGAVQDIGKKAPADYGKYIEPAARDIPDHVPPRGTLSEEGKLIPPSYEEQLAALKAYQARKYPGRVAAPPAKEPGLHQTPLGQELLDIRRRSLTEPPAGPSGAPPVAVAASANLRAGTSLPGAMTRSEGVPTGESLGDLGRAISTDRPKPPPVTSSEALVEGAQRAHRKTAPAGPAKPAAKGPRTAAKAVEEKTAREATAPPPTDVEPVKANPAGQLLTPMETPKPGGRPRVPVNRKETPPNPGELDTPPKYKATAKEYEVIQRIKRGEQVNPQEMQAVVQKLRDAFGSEQAAKISGVSQSKVKKLTKSSGEAPSQTIRKVLEAAGSITDPAEAERYLNSASYNIREVLRASFKKRGLIK